nr:hypothetical protein [Lachnospiraceae bacterium]
TLVVLAKAQETEDLATPLPTAPADEGESSDVIPNSADSNTIQLGDSSAGHSVTLGDSVSSMKSKLGTPVRIDADVRGFKTYIYNPSNDYINYLQVYVDNDEVIGFATISGYFAFDSYVKAGATKSELTSNGFSNKIDNDERGYMKTITAGSESYNVVVYFDTIKGGDAVDQMTGDAMGIQVYPSSYTNSQMFKAGAPYASTCDSSGAYYVNEGINYELCEFVNAYRAMKGIDLLSIASECESDVEANGINLIYYNPAQQGAENASTTSEGSGLSNYSKRITKALGFACYVTESYTQDDTDALDAFKTLLIESSDDNDTAAKLISYDVQACIGGFAVKGDTVYIVLDMWGYKAS